MKSERLKKDNKVTIYLNNEQYDMLKVITKVYGGTYAHTLRTILTNGMSLQEEYLRVSKCIDEKSGDINKIALIKNGNSNFTN